MAGLTIRDIGILFGYDVDKASEDRVEASVQNLKNFASNALGAIGLSLSIAGITSAIKDCVSLASEVEEMENKFNVVFQGINEEVDAWAQNYADAIGRNKNDIKTYLADQQNLLVGFGMTREEGAKLSEEMTSLALDLASFGNLDEASAVNNMTKAVMGESEAAKGLGAVLNDTTRAQAMLDLGLSGTYDSLDQLTKMQVNYQAILSQSPDAIGDCKRSLDSYQSTMKQYQAKLKEIKTIIGQFFMPTAQKILRFGAQGLTILRDFVVRLSSFIDSIGGSEKALAILSATLAGMFAIMNIGKLGAAASTFAKLASTFGLAAAKAAILFTSILLVVLLIQDFISFMQGKDSLIGVMLEKSGVDCDALRDKVRDTWNSIKSVWETIESVAASIWNGLKNFWIEHGEQTKSALVSAWNAIKTVATSIWGGLKNFWSEHGEQIKSALVTAWNVIKTVLITAWNVIKTVAMTIFGGLQTFWANHGEQIKGALVNTWIIIKNLLTATWNIIKTVAMSVFGALMAFWNVWGNTIIAYFSGVWGIIKSVFGTVLNVLTDLFAVFASLFAGDWSGLWQNVKQLLSDIWNGILSIVGSVLSAIWGVVSSIFSTIWGFISGIVQNIWNAISTAFTNALTTVSTIVGNILTIITTTFSNIRSSVVETVAGIRDSIVNGFQAAIDWIRALPSQAFQWGADIINSIINGINSVVSGIGEAVSGVAGTIRSFLHFSEPDEGPLSDFHTYMPDMIDLMTKGIRTGRQRVKKAAEELAGDMSMPIQSAGEQSAGGGKYPKQNANGKPDFLGVPGDIFSALRGFVGYAGSIARSAGRMIVNNKDAIRSTASNLTNNMSALSRSAIPSASTVRTATTNNSTSNRTINFRSEIRQEFNGDMAAQQHIAKAADSAADDTTGVLARALSYA